MAVISEIVVDEEALRLSGADRAYADTEAAHALKAFHRRRGLCLCGRAPVQIGGAGGLRHRHGLDGACRTQSVAALSRARLVLARPGGAPDTVAQLRAEVGDLI